MLDIFAELSLKEDIRGEALAIEQVVALSNRLTEQIETRDIGASQRWKKMQKYM